MKERGVVGALWRTFGGLILKGLCFSLVIDLFQFTQPLLLDAMITSADLAKAGQATFETSWKGVFYATLMFGAVSIQTITISYYIYHMQNIAIRVQAALMSAVYR